MRVGLSLVFTVDSQGWPSEVVTSELRSKLIKSGPGLLGKEQSEKGSCFPRARFQTLLCLTLAFSASSRSHFSSSLLLFSCHYIIYCLTQIWIWEFGLVSYITQFSEVGFFLPQNLGHNAWQILSRGNWLQLCVVPSLWMRHFPKSLL